MNGDHVAVRVSEAECSPERPVERRRYDLDTCLRQRVVDTLGVFGVKPKSHANARAWLSCAEVNARKRFTYGKRNG